jgi:hypothetical protein
MSVPGTELPIPNVRYPVAKGGKADSIGLQLGFPALTPIGDIDRQILL